MTPARIAATGIAGKFAENRAALGALALLAILVLAAVFAPWISPQNPYDLGQLDLVDSRLPPLAHSAAGAVRWLGTDDQGRDMLSAILYGLRTSLVVGLASTALGFAIGVSLGLAAAWFGGWFDALVMRLADLQLSFPSILIALVLLAVFGQGLEKIIFALVAPTPPRWSSATRNTSRPPSRSRFPARASCSVTCCPTACRRSSCSRPSRSPRRSRSKPRCLSWAWACRSRSPRSAS
jgi:peptide/nickel transport system permease protein